MANSITFNIDEILYYYRLILLDISKNQEEFDIDEYVDAQSGFGYEKFVELIGGNKELLFTLHSIINKIVLNS